MQLHCLHRVWAVVAAMAVIPSQLVNLQLWQSEDQAAEVERVLMSVSAMILSQEVLLQ